MNTIRTKKVIYTSNPGGEIWSLLGLFESKKIVQDALMTKFSSMSLDELTSRTEQIIYSIRQAREFFNSANEVTVLTSPLLLSYGMLNLGKALVYFQSSVGEQISESLHRHGLTASDNASAKSLADECVTLKGYGAYPAIANCFGQVPYADITLDLKALLSQIPDLMNTYELIYKERSSLSIFNNKKSEYVTTDIFEETRYFGLIDHYLREHHIRVCHSSKNVHILQAAAASTPLNKLDCMVRSTANIDFFRKFPIVNSVPIILKEASLYYILIFSFGMLARYHSIRWGKYINPDISSEAEIIIKSVGVARERFLHLIVNGLFEEEFEFKKEAQFKTGKEVGSLDFDTLYNKLVDKYEDDLRRHVRRLPVK